MTRRRLVAVALAALTPLVAVAVLAGCGGKGAPSTTTEQVADAADAADAASPPLDGGAEDGGAADADADAAVDAPVEAEAGPPRPLFSDEPFPDKRSPMPKPAEWEAAPLVSIDRGACGCDVRRVREWLRFSGPWDGGLLLLGGSADGMWLRKGEIVLPVRRGDRREIELLKDNRGFFVKGLESTHVPEFAGVLSEQWIAGDERPWIVVQ